MHKITQRGDWPLIHELRVCAVAFVVAGTDGRLQHRDDIRVVTVILAAVHVLQETALSNRFAWLPRQLCQCLLVAQQVIETGSLDSRGSALETAVDDFVRKPDDLEKLRAAVTGNRRDTHLRHHLEQALADAAPVAAAELPLLVDIAALADVVQRLVGEVRVHRRRTVADQAGEVMRIARHTGLHDDVGVAAQPLGNEVVVHGTRRQQRMNRKLAGLEVAIAEHDDELATPDRGFGLVADLVERVGQRHRVIDIEIDELVIVSVHVRPEQLPELFLRQHG